MNAWLVQHFFNPAFVLPWGAALVASPIIIHLINRMRYRRVRFAAMAFLLQSQHRSRRRILFEQQLLLLLRILIVLALLALVARLILDPSEMSIFRGAKAHHFVLLDDSGSQQDRWGETTAFDEAVGVVKKLVAEGSRRPDTQMFTLLKLSDPTQPLFVERNVNDTFVNELETKLENVRCSHRALDLLKGVQAARELLEAKKDGIKHLHIISDFRLADWQSQKALGNALKALDRAGVTVNLVRTVRERNANLALTHLRGDVQVAAAGVPLHLSVGVKNFGEQVADDVRLSILQDGQKLPLTIQFERIEAGVEVTREFDVTFSTPHKHRLEVRLETDSIAQDNTRYLAIDMAVANPVLIIDGDPLADEASYVADALAADPGITGFAPQIEQVDFLRNHSLEKFQAIYMLNVPEIPLDALESLSDYVKSGGGLAWFLGNAVKPAFYNDALYLAGKGLFPVPLGSARRQLLRDQEANPGPDLVLSEHPIFGILAGQDNPFVESVRIRSYQPVSDVWERDDNQRTDGVSTIATLRNRQPLMFEHRYGQGRILTSLTSAGPPWNNWAQNPSYVVFQLELEKHIAYDDRSPDRRLVGEPIALSLDPVVYTETVEITAPDAAGERITRMKAAPTGPNTGGNGSDHPTTTNGASATGGPGAETGSAKLTANYRETDRPGIYTIKLFDHNQQPQEQWIAYNVPLKESDLRLATNSQIRQQIGEDVAIQIQDPGSFQWIAGKDAGQEVRKLLIVLLCCLLLSEQLLAYRFTYHPEPTSVSA